MDSPTSHRSVPQCVGSGGLNAASCARTKLAKATRGDSHAEGPKASAKANFAGRRGAEPSGTYPCGREGARARTGPDVDKGPAASASIAACRGSSLTMPRSRGAEGDDLLAASVTARSRASRTVARREGRSRKVTDGASSRSSSGWAGGDDKIKVEHGHLMSSARVWQPIAGEDRRLHTPAGRIVHRGLPNVVIFSMTGKPLEVEWTRQGHAPTPSPKITRDSRGILADVSSPFGHPQSATSKRRSTGAAGSIR